MPDLVVEKVTKEFSTQEASLPILREVSLSLSSGQNLAILGPSGCGKSTLLHLIGGLDRPTSGKVLLEGEELSSMNDTKLARFRNERIGFIFQDHHLLPQLSVLENTLIPALAFGTPSKEQEARAKALIERVGLSHRLSHRPGELSGGERQRVGVARALLLRPKLLLADEPTGNLDRTNGEAVGTLLLQMQQEENTMLVVVTHSPQLAERMQRRMQILDGYLEPQ